MSQKQLGTQIMEKGCKLCEKYKEHCYHDHLNGKAVEFYEFMHGEFSQYVRIPKKFAHCFRGEYSETVDLKGPSGKIWPVGLKETNNGMLLQSGWKEFAEAHHIQESYLLVFKYDEKSCLDVSIFDENRCKKAACYLFMDSNAEKQERSEDSVEVLNVKSRRKVNGNTPPGFHHDDMRHIPSTRTERAALKYQRTESSCKTRNYRHNELSARPKNKQCNPSCYLFMDSNTEKRERSADFVEVLNVKSRRKVDGHTPPGFHHDDMRHVPPTRNERVALKYHRTESSCKTGNYRHNEVSAHPKNKQCKPCLYIGVHGRRYNIKQESVGIHDLEKLDRPNVYITRRKILTYEEIERALQLLDLVQPKNPCFISFLQPGSVYNRCYLYVPQKFQKAHLPSESCNVVLQVPDQRKTWCAGLFVYDSVSRFCWESFVIDNSLQVGDACLFELADDPTVMVMTVSILRADDQDC